MQLPLLYRARHSIDKWALLAQIASRAFTSYVLPVAELTVCKQEAYDRLRSGFLLTLKTLLLFALCRLFTCGALVPRLETLLLVSTMLHALSPIPVFPIQ